MRENARYQTTISVSRLYPDRADGNRRYHWHTGRYRPTQLPALCDRQC